MSTVPMEALPADEEFVSIFGRTRLVTCLAPLLFMLCGAFAGGDIVTIRSSATILLVSLLTLVCVLRPDSNLGLGLIVTMALYWAVTVTNPRTAWVAPAALCLLLVHTSLAASTTSPVDRPTNATRDRWTRRTGVVGIVTVAVWGATYLFGRFSSPRSVLLSALGFVIVCVIALGLRAGSRVVSSPTLGAAERPEQR
jgi:type IV secretory pathway VirB2 component (pilin)